MIRAGELSEADASIHPYRHVLTRAIGVVPEVDIDYAGVTCEPGDRLLLCTDGLFKALSPDELNIALVGKLSPKLAHQLVTSAVECDAEDNVTVVIIDVH